MCTSSGWCVSAGTDGGYAAVVCVGGVLQDEHLAHMDNLVARMRRQQQPRTHKQAPPGTSSLGDGQRGSAWHHLASLSPTKPQRLRAGLAAGAAPHADS
jgi:hypothetical protein